MKKNLFKRAAVVKMRYALNGYPYAGFRWNGSGKGHAHTGPV